MWLLQDFQSGNSEADQFYPAKAGSIKLGGMVIINNAPCKVIEYSKVKDGKHGHAKVNMTGVDIFTKKKYFTTCPASHNVEVPIISKQEMELQNIEDGYIHLLTPSGIVREDIKLPSGDLGDEISERFNKETATLCILQTYNGRAKVIEVKDYK
ncbi:eukaryotic translation initiation factor 5A-1-like [Entamoeba marina]